jgi:YHS domain-containing protein
MIRSFIEQFILPLLVFLAVRAILGNLFNRPVSGRGPGPQSSDIAPSMELKKDPVCGMYVSPATGVSRTVQGHTIYFCSKECRDKFVA